MAVPTNTRQTYGGRGPGRDTPPGGMREDLSDIIYNISPEETPFMSGIGKGSCKNTYFEWQTDALVAPADNRKIEGDDPDALAVVEPPRLGNNTQISEKTVQTSGTAESVDWAGRKSSQAYQLAKRAKEIKRDMEFMLLSDDVKSEGAAGTARATAGYQAWMGTDSADTSNAIDGGGLGVVNTSLNGAFPTGDAVPAAGAGGALDSLDEINLCIQRIWELGGNPDTIMCSGAHKVALSELGSSVVAGLRTQTGTSGPATAINAVDVLVTDFGTFKLVPNRFCDPSVVYIIDFDMWSIDYLRPFKTETLAKTGDSVKQMMIAEYGLRSKNSHGSGMVFNLT